MRRPTPGPAHQPASPPQQPPPFLPPAPPPHPPQTHPHNLNQPRPTFPQNHPASTPSRRLTTLTNPPNPRSAFPQNFPHAPAPPPHFSHQNHPLAHTYTPIPFSKEKNYTLTLLRLRQSTSAILMTIPSLNLEAILASISFAIRCNDKLDVTTICFPSLKHLSTSNTIIPLLQSDTCSAPKSSNTSIGTAVYLSNIFLVDSPRTFSLLDHADCISSNNSATTTNRHLLCAQIIQH